MGVVWKNVYGFVFMFPYNPQNLNPDRTATFSEKFTVEIVFFYDLHGEKHCACLTVRGKPR